ncbi:MAG: hypothetical protein IPN53_05285 [Comamonadaceae bacterium]|nr:hypothetical protein [Comamonadaceae bacterium]
MELRDLASMVEGEKSDLLKKTEWYRRFNSAEVSSALRKDEKKQRQLQRDLDKARAELVDQTSSVKILKTKASLGWDPRYWFSSERSLKVLELKAQRKTLAVMTKHEKQLQQQFDVIHQQNKLKKGELEDYRAFDPLEAQAAVNALIIRLERIRSDLDHVQLLSKRLDMQLREPLAELAKFKQRKRDLEIEIARAEDFEHQLSIARNSYERKMIHNECINSFGDSSPGRVVGYRRRDLGSVDRSIRNLDERLKSIASQAHMW